MANISDYLELITSEHADKPKFKATITALVQGLTDNNNLCLALPGLYNLDTAVGTQLDAVGLWVGVSRLLRIPIAGVYFSWDAPAIDGWESGVWQGPYDSTSGLSSLPDDAYRILIRAKIAANNWDGTIPGAIAIYATIFGGTRTIIIQDNQDMSFVLGFVGTALTAIEQELLIGGYLPLKPSGVRINSFVLPPGAGTLFAWDTVSPLFSGWETGQYAIEIHIT